MCLDLAGESFMAIASLIDVRTSKQIKFHELHYLY